MKCTHSNGHTFQLLMHLSILLRAIEIISYQVLFCMLNPQVMKSSHLRSLICFLLNLTDREEEYTSYILQHFQKNFEANDILVSHFSLTSQSSHLDPSGLSGSLPSFIS